MRFLYIIIFITISATLFAQKEQEVQENPKIVKARTLIKDGKSSKAFSLLNKLYSKTQDNNVGVELVNLYYQQNNSDKASEWAAQIGLEESLNKKDVILYSKLLIQNGNYQEALDHCLNYALQKNDSKGISEIAYACEELINAEKDAVLYNIKEVPFNTVGDEVSITNYRRNYVMASNGLSENSHFDFYILQQDFNKWRFPEPLLRKAKTNINRTGLSFSYDGNYIYYSDYEFISTKAKKKLGNKIVPFNIHSAIIVGGNLANVKKFPNQKEGFSYKDPAIHPDGKLLVFASNQNGKGNYDLFYSILKDTLWTKPISLGSNVNTTADEVKPYFRKNGELYFSSNTKLGFGGYDLYKTQLSNDIWIKPDILPPPLNSKYNDMGILFHYQNPGGFIVSDRKGNKSSYDVYEFEDFNLKMSISVVNANDGSLLPYAEIKLYKEGILIGEKLTGKNGDVTFQVASGMIYQIEVSKDGFEKLSKEVSANNRLDGEEFYVNATIKMDANFIEAVKKEEVKFNNQNFITFRAQVVDKNEKPIPHNSFKIINSNTGRMKFIQTDKDGKFEQSLFIGNKYKLIFEHNNKVYEKFYDTINMEVSTKNVLFILENESDNSQLEK